MKNLEDLTTTEEFYYWWNQFNSIPPKPWVYLGFEHKEFYRCLFCKKRLESITD